MNLHKHIIVSLLCLSLIFSFSLYGKDAEPKSGLVSTKSMIYPFTSDPIDVVITMTSVDLLTLDLCIDGIRENGKNVRRIIVISDKRYTENAEWIDSASFPFTRADISLAINQGNVDLAEWDLNDSASNVEVYYNQLLNLYAAYVIPDLSPNYLSVDPDTVFLNPVEFQNEKFAGLYNSSLKSCKDALAHAKRLVPNFKRAYYVYSGQASHMLFQKCVVDHLFKEIEDYHQTPFWKAYCDKIDNRIANAEGASAYEFYFNFVFSKSKQVKIRKLKYLDVVDLSAINPLKEYGYDYISCRAWKRDWFINEVKRQLAIFQKKAETETPQDIIKSDLPTSR